MMNKITKEEAFIELKFDFVRIMHEFTYKYPELNQTQILLNVLVECLSEAEYLVEGCPSFTRKQADHICYQIGEWYGMMKPLLEGQHNLGYMKERLKIMICGEEL